MAELEVICGKNSFKLNAETGENIASILLKNNIFITMPCMGKFKCGKCKVIASGHLSKISDYEKETLGAQLIKNGYRLSCTALILGDTKIIIDSIEDDYSFKYNVHSDKNEKYIFCIDLGTTNIETSLISVNNNARKLISSEIHKNPTCMYGADVISRAEKSINGEKENISKKLCTFIKDSLNSLNINQKKIEEIVITANTTMLCLLTGKDCKTLTKFPFKNPDNFGYYTSSLSLGISSADINIYFPMCISAFVGADTLCACIASDFQNDNNNNVKLLIDIGTNGEIVLKNKTKICCTSTAMGSAFESAHLYNGINASKGAINKVYIEDSKIKYDTILNKPAAGICASGVIDLISVLKKLYIIDETGTFDKDNKYVTIFNGQPAFKFDDTCIYFTQKDIRNAQEAKSAMCAGIKSIIKYMQIEEDKISAVILTGNFGKYINIKNAVNIGLIPQSFKDKCKAYSNLALRGTEKMALDDSIKKESIKFAQKAANLSLSEYTYFSQAYMDCMYIEKI